MIHRLFYCEKFKEKSRILKLKIGERWRLIRHPIDLILMCGSPMEVSSLIKHILLYSNGVGLLKYKFNNIISDEVIYMKKQKLLKFKKDLKKNKNKIKSSNSKILNYLR